jgi:hypothetical protein
MIGFILTKASSIGLVVLVGGGTVTMIIDLHATIRKVKGVFHSNTRAPVEAVMLATLLALDLTLQSKVALRTEAVHEVLRRVFPEDLIRKHSLLISLDAELALSLILTHQCAFGDLSFFVFAMGTAEFRTTPAWAVRFIQASIPEGKDE